MAGVAGREGIPNAASNSKQTLLSRNERCKMAENSNLSQNNEIVILLDATLYQKEAIQNAAHRFLGNFYIQMAHQSETIIKLILIPKENADTKSIELEFMNELIDQQVRISVEKSYGNIRDLIVKQAFQPVENIQNEIKI
jgi:His-Xaa-Ser system protein HxsD